MRGVLRSGGGQPAPSRAERSSALGWVQVAPVKAFTSVCYREGIIFQRERTSYTRHKLRASKVWYIFHLCELGTTQVKVVKGLYTEVRNVQHVARGRVSRAFVFNDRESFE